MLKTNYNIPIFEDTDAADLNKYSNEMANALKTQINNTNNEIKEIDKKVVDAVNKFTEPLSYKGQVSTIQDLPTGAINGDIYNVTSENKNYIYNGTNWVEYSSTLDLTYLENNTKTTQTTEVSEELTIENCAGVKGKLDIKSGKSIEEGEPSPDNIIPIRNVGDNIQLFDKDNANTLKATINITNKAIQGNNDTKLAYLKVKPNTTYTVSKVASTRFIIGSCNGIPVAGTTTCSSIVNGNTESKLTITTTENDNYLCIYYYYNQTDTLTEQEIRDSIKVEQGSTLTPYTPYNCGSTDFKITGKNKLKITSFVNRTTDGVTFTAKFDKKGNLEYINAVGNSTTGYRDIMRVDISNLPEGKYKINGLGTDKVIRYVLLKGNNAEPKIITTNTDVEFTQDSASPYLHFRIDLYMAGEVNATIKPMIRPSIITDNTYEPYQEQIVSFPFTEGQVIHKDDYIMNNKIHQNRKTYTITGNENWVLTTGTTNFLGIYLNDVIKDCVTNEYSINVQSNIATGVEYNNRWKNVNTVSCRANTLTLTLDNVTTLQEAKAYLKSQYANGTPVTLEYELAEEIVIPYTPEQEQAYYELQHLLMYEGYTSIECIDEIKPDIQVEYSYNNEINTTYGKKIDTLEARIRQLEQMITSQSEVVE